MNATAADFTPANGGIAAEPGKPPPPGGSKPPKIKGKPAPAVPQSLSAMNLAMTPEEEAIAGDVDAALQADCSAAERTAAAGRVGKAVKTRAYPPPLPPAALITTAARSH